MPEEIPDGFFLIDKEVNWTSFQVVNKLRYVFKHKCKIKKIKIGHAGTLDPLASGLLIVCYGKATKQISAYQDLKKEYTGLIRLGATRPSFDMETEIDKKFPTDHISDEDIRQQAEKMLGEQDQLPPQFSAKRVEGVRAYELARQGEVVMVRPNRIEIFEFDVKREKEDLFSFRIVCSKGTYIRSIANDIGKALNSGAYLESLRRTAIGDYRVEDALKVKELEARFEEVVK